MQLDNVYFVTCPKQGLEIEAVVLHRVEFLENVCPKQGQYFKPLAAPLYPNMDQVPPPGISMTFQTNINSHIVRDEFVVKKRFLANAGVIFFFPAESVVTMRRLHNAFFAVLFCVWLKAAQYRPVHQIEVLTAF